MKSQGSGIAVLLRFSITLILPVVSFAAFLGNPSFLSPTLRPYASGSCLHPSSTCQCPAPSSFSASKCPLSVTSSSRVLATSSLCMNMSQRPKGSPFQKRKVVQPTKADTEEFLSIINLVRASPSEAVPSILASQVEFLLSRDLAALEDMLFEEFPHETEQEDFPAILDTILVFLEEFVAATSNMAEASRSLLREILEAAAAGMVPLERKIAFVVSGQETRYTPEFLRFLDSEITRISTSSPPPPAPPVDAATKRFAASSALSQLDAGNPEEEEEEEEGGAADVPDRESTLRVLTLIKAMLNAALEITLGADASPAELFSRLLQVDETAQRIIALETALSEMRDREAQARFFDVVTKTLRDLEAMEGQGNKIDQDLIARVRQVQSTTASRLGMKQ